MINLNNPQKNLYDSIFSTTKLLVVILAINPSCINAQSLSNPFRTLKETKKFIYGFDNRRTRIGEQNASIYGLYLGIGFGGKLRFKAGISEMPFQKGKVVDDQNLIQKNRLLFGVFGEEFDFLVYKKLRFTTYFQAGMGYNFFRKIDKMETEILTGRNPILPLEIGAQSNYSISPGLTVKVGGGYRFVLPAHSYHLSGSYFKVGLNINSRKLLEKYRMKKNANR
jgi:hypothetical protein